MAQVEEISAQYRELEARGVELFLISPQSQKRTKALAKRFDGSGTETVLPTVVIIDPDRTIIFADLTDNYRVRPEPSTFLAVLDAQR